MPFRAQWDASSGLHSSNLPIFSSIINIEDNFFPDACILKNVATLLYSSIATLFLLITHSLLFGQVDSIVPLEEIHVSATRIHQHATGSMVQSINLESLDAPYASLAEMLSEEAGVYVKNYGPGSLATSSIRGGSAGHTLVLWNGLALQNPMLGLLDLALIPASNIEEVTLQRGGNSALSGSGAIGGVISLNNHIPTDPVLLKGRSILGAFGLLRQDISMQVRHKSISSSTKINFQRADNDFPIDIDHATPGQRQINAGIQLFGLQQDLSWKINGSDRLTIHFWHQQTRRDIPPTTTQNGSQAFQEDLSSRVMLDWQRLKKFRVYHGKIAYFFGEIDFQDPMISLVANSRFHTILGDMGSEWHFSQHHKLYLGVLLTSSTADAPALSDHPSEFRSAAIASYQWSKDKWKAQVSARQTRFDNRWAPLIPQIGLEYNLSPQISLLGRLSRNFRLPTLNDRYWQPGGNPKLAPEQGWSAEATIRYDKTWHIYRLQSSMTTFSRSIRNWILWRPLTGSSFWSPENIAKVWSRGIEWRASLKVQLSQFMVTLNLGYDYLKSTNQIGLSHPKIDVGSQLIYTPSHQANFSTQMKWRSWYARYDHRFYGKTSGINDNISSYEVADIKLGCRIGRDQKINLFFEIQNIWDQTYVVIERRPMPGTSYQAGISFKI
jgi:iron complex outermembrane receptor protein